MMLHEIKDFAQSNKKILPKLGKTTVWKNEVYRHFALDQYVENI